MSLIPAAIHPGEFERLSQSVSDPLKLELIQLTLSVGVPFAIHDLQKQGGPEDYHFGEALAFSTRLGAEGDTLLYRTKGNTAQMMDTLIDMIAILAFCPGGITTFGLHFEAEPEPDDPPATVDPGELPPWPDVEPPLQPPAQPEEVMG